MPFGTLIAKNESSRKFVRLVTSDGFDEYLPVLNLDGAVNMKSISKFLGTAASLVLATMGAAHAIPVLPEPGSIALVGLGIAGVVFFSRRK